MLILPVKTMHANILSGNVEKENPDQAKENPALSIFDIGEQTVRNGNTTRIAKKDRFRIWYPNPYCAYLKSGAGAEKEKLEEKVIPAYFEQVVHYVQDIASLDKHILNYEAWLDADDAQRDKKPIKIDESPENFYYCMLIGQYALISLIVTEHKENSTDKEALARAVVRKIKARGLVKDTAYTAVPELNPKIKEDPSKMNTYVKTELNNTLIEQCVDDAVQAFQARFRHVPEMLGYERDRHFFLQAINDEMLHTCMQRIEFLLGLSHVQEQGISSPYGDMLKHVNAIKEIFPEEFSLQR